MSPSVSAKVSEADRHLAEVTSLIFFKNKLYSGADDGKVKVWSPDLKLLKEIDAHPVNVYAIAASDDTLYTSSNDGTVKAWSIDSLEHKKTLLNNPNNEVLQLIFIDKKLYAGDDKGNVFVFENDELAGKYEVGEEVWDILVSDNLLLTVRNLDVTIIEMKPGGKQYTYLHSISGRSPLKEVGKHFCFTDRDGKVINIHELSKESKFTHNATIKAHDMIINALSCTDEPQPTIFSGGYDKILKRWDVQSQSCSADLQVDTVINALASGPTAATVYVAGAVGYITRVDF